MIVSSEDRILFFKLWLPLVQFGSLMFDLHAEDLVLPESGIDQKAAREVAEAIWQHTNIIDDYLAARDDLSRNERRIVMRWKKVIYGDFVIERHLRGGSIFISLKDQRVFLVKGITDSFPELFKDISTPFVATTALLPFKEAVISDGLFKLHDVSFRSGYKQAFEKCYMNAKQDGRIISTPFQWPL